MKRAITLILCAFLLFTMSISVRAQESTNGTNTKSEAEILDEMATCWIDTCTKNIELCDDGLIIYSLGKVELFNEEMIREVYKPLKDGLFDPSKAGSENVLLSLQMDDVMNAYDDNLLGKTLEDAAKAYCETKGAEMGTDDFEVNVTSKLTIDDILKNGKIVEEVTVMDIIKENYALCLGKASCEEAREYFRNAKGTNDLALKRNYMLIGASLATFGCEMTIEKTDEIVKAPYTRDEFENDLQKQHEMMADIAEKAISVAEELVPQIEVINDVIEVSTDIALKALSMGKKLNTLAGFIKAPNTIEENKSAYYDALSNQFARFAYEIVDFEIVMDEYKGYLLDSGEYVKVDIPAYLYGFPVVAFDGVFADNLIITEITIPSTIKSRSLTNVVNNCDKLKEVHYNAISCPGQYIGYFFNNCDSDFKVIFGEGVEVIPEQFIANSGISSIAFPDGIRTMHSGALVHCEKLKTVTIPHSVEKFEITLLSNVPIVSDCANLETVYYNAASPEGSYHNAVFADCGNDAEEMSLVLGGDVKITPVTFLRNCGVKSVVFPEGMTQIREYAITDCEKLETITIPSTIVDFSDNLATDYVFSGCNNLKTVNYNAQNAAGETGTVIFDDIQSDFKIRFGENIESIPENFISNCALTEIAFPEGVKTIRYNCLVDCDSLQTVVVPSTVETIEYNFAEKCDGIKYLYFNANCTTSPNTAMISECGNFGDSGMEVLLGECVTTVPAHFIENCAIVEFVYPEGTKCINDQSLEKCSILESVVIPSTVERIGCRVVSECSKLKTIEYNALNAERIDAFSYVFYNSGDADGMEICFGENVESLPNKFMTGCSVRSVSFPSGLAEIPERAFYKCTSLNTLTIPMGITTIAAEAFKECTGLTNMYFNAVNVADMKIAQGTFDSAGELGNGINVVIGKNTTRIPSNLFCPTGSVAGSPKIVSVTFEENSACASIGSSAFADCVSLPAINIPSCVKTIGEEAFAGCAGLTDVTMNNGILTIEKAAFSQCTGLPGIKIPNSVTTIGESVFSDCTALSAVTLGSNITEISRFAFRNCAGLAKISIPDNVACIASSAFYDCTGLTAVTIQDGVTDIGTSAFSGCDGLNSVIYCGTENQWDAIQINTRGNENLVDANRKYHDWVEDSETRILTCRVCGKTKCEALGHDWKEATCTSAQKCESCGKTEGDALKHICDQEVAENKYLKAEATCTSKAIYYKSCSCGETGTDTFEYGKPLDHVYDQQKVTADYLKSEATQSEKAVYFYSCVCGLASETETFQYGEPASHEYVLEVVDDKYLKSPATCTDPAVYYKSCECGEMGTDTFEYGKPLDHVYDQKEVADDYLKNEATHSEKAVYFYSCVCGLASETETFQYGEPASHEYVLEIAEDKYLKSPATCTTEAVYYKSCECGEIGTEEFTYGKLADHKVQNGICTHCETVFIQITKQPRSVTVDKDAKAKVSVTATGDGLTYAWYYKNKDASKFSKSTASTSDSYSVTMSESRNGRQVYCVIKDKYGNSIKTKTVTLSIKAVAEITEQPKSVAVENGVKARTSVTATGDGLTYTWYYKNRGASKFSKSTDSTGCTYSTTMSESRNGRQVYCVVKDKYGNSVKTETVTLSLKVVAKITKQPKSVTVENGEKAKISVTATGDGLTYTWYYKNKDSAQFSKSTASTGSSYSITMSETRNGRQVYCVIKDKYGNSVKTETVTLSIKVEAEIIKQPKSVAVAEGEKAKVSVTAAGDGLTYTWYYKNKGASKFSKSTSFKGSSYSPTMSESCDGRQVYCVVKDKYGNSVKTKTATLSLKVEVEITKQPRSVTVESGTKAKVSVTASGDGLTYTWYYKNKGASKFSKSTSFKGSSYSPTMSESCDGRQVYCVVKDKYGNSVKSKTVTLNMK